MKRIRVRRGYARRENVWPLLLMATTGTMLTGEVVWGQERDSLAGEKAAQALKQAIETEGYNLRYGDVRFRTEASLGVSYTDNVFYSREAEEDVLIHPDITLGALWPITEANALRLSLGLSYEWYLKNDELNAGAPLINPGSELSFHVFIGDFHITLHERFSYQESLFFSSFSGETTRFYNFNDVGTFARLNNEVGFNVEWDLNKLILIAGYNHENFITMTDSFEYLDRASEWFTTSAGVLLGDKVQSGLEGRASWHDYDEEITLNDHWRAQVGPFVDVKFLGKVTLRAGGGFDTAQFNGSAAENSDFESYYWYARVRQELRTFSHAVTAGREHMLGDNANNLRTTFARYSISSPVVRNIDLQANLSVNFAEEFGGTFAEEFTYYGAGVRIGSQFHRDWRADLGYEYRLKESDLEERDFDRNRVTLAVTYRF